MKTPFNTIPNIIDRYVRSDIDRYRSIQRYLKFDTLQLSYRVSNRCFHIYKREVLALDIGHIEIHENYRRRGFFKKLIEDLHGYNPTDVTYIPYVETDYIHQYFQSNCWICIGQNSYLKETKHFCTIA